MHEGAGQEEAEDQVGELLQQVQDGHLAGERHEHGDAEDHHGGGDGDGHGPAARNDLVTGHAGRCEGKGHVVEAR
ncbi:hypothetical protein GCM10009817_33370 [Terrabacter lapilli]|uniref:Uncharacterized protein n=1 Tax=Terrabacter lapilli TaxID=436231 RepID=A0ABN2SLW7_9MICO